MRGWQDARSPSITPLAHPNHASAIAQTFGNMKNSALSRLAEWYTSQCNGLWEHEQGIEIGTLDNPGFRIKISVFGTPLETVDFDRVEDDYDSDDHWFTCWKEDGQFHAAGAPCRIEDMIECFLAWADTGRTENLQAEQNIPPNDR